MPVRLRACTVLALVILWLLPPAAFAAGSAGAEGVRESILAGTWYPDDPEELRRTVQGYLDGVASHTPDVAPIAMIVPHAGYAYSGPVAAHAYKLLEKHPFKTVVIIAPSHHARFPGVSVYDRGGYRTPLGVVPLDEELIGRLKAADPSLRYVPAAHDREHAVEIELPFLQVANPGFKLVPLVMGVQDLDTCRRLANALAAGIRDDSVLIIASTDLSHYHSYEDAQKLDSVVLKHVPRMDAERLHADFVADRCEACGAGPMVSAMLAARALGANRSRVLLHANSGDVTGDKSKVVGYLAAAMWNSEGKRTFRKISAPVLPAKAALTEADRAKLLEIARQSVRAAVTGEAQPPMGEVSAALRTPTGAFVTLKENGELRGCIGHVIGKDPLAQTVREVAAAAATEDPRFPPVQEAELGKLEYEISVMSPLRKIEDVEEIEVGVHGIFMRNNFRSGLLLPQVATEFGWDRQTFLEQTCRKTGLPKECWKQKSTLIYVFSAEVF